MAQIGETYSLMSWRMYVFADAWPSFTGGRLCDKPDRWLLASGRASRVGFDFAPSPMAALSLMRKKIRLRIIGPIWRDIILRGAARAFGRACAGSAKALGQRDGSHSRLLSAIAATRRSSRRAA